MNQKLAYPHANPCIGKHATYEVTNVDEVLKRILYAAGTRADAKTGSESWLGKKITKDRFLAEGPFVIMIIRALIKAE